MSNIPYYNRTGQFWDWVASLEEQGSNHPFFGRPRGEGNDETHPNPWMNGWAGFPFGPLPYRGHHQAPPPPPDAMHMQPPPPEYEETSGHSGDEEAPEKARDPEEGPSEPRGPHPGPHGSRRCHADGGRGVHRAHSRGRGCGRGRGSFGGFGGRGRGGPFGRHVFGPMGGIGALADMFQSQFFGDSGANHNKNGKEEDFCPEVDVFDTTDAFFIHVSLPGAKKEDVGVNWDHERSELSIAGVVYRPIDEETLKSLALDERKVGAFERKVRLGSRANPAQVDADAITAKLEDGVLKIEVPKLDREYVEIKRVDIA
ncbi:hypothetical protein M433DRAFT_517439 [Acidomyces richmondensis BFW]|nr:MAG: hypothetical protein FE78DRAFT_331519 [Acidomyces sp. 'richmondensis']KYG50119.1 hypothetical protein M433DRAFT_517439 [Acidomyces richmondensis BFW]